VPVEIIHKVEIEIFQRHNGISKNFFRF
jgi:hypothetical protein